MKRKGKLPKTGERPNAPEKRIDGQLLELQLHRCHAILGCVRQFLLVTPFISFEDGFVQLYVFLEDST